MKKVLITICLSIILLIVGCDAWSGKAWYNPEKPIWQAIRDCEDCDSISYEIKGLGVSQFTPQLLIECMNSKGYELYEVSQLRENNQIKIKPNLINAGWSLLAFRYPIAGKITND